MTNRVSSTGAQRWFSAIGFVLASLSPLTIVRADEPFVLAWPVACELGQTCFVQNFVDHDSSDAAKDFRCGSRTYNNHDGTDIRLIDTQAEEDGASVLAAAAGRVLRTRDGVSDISIRVAGRAAVAGKECGNGLVIDHGDGWSTQYCHLKKGSVVVMPDEVVKAGAPLGMVGLSGETEVPHLHLTVRHNGTVVDPFAYGQPPETCSGGRSLWSRPISDSFRYQEREIMNFGFAGTVATMDGIESGELRQQKPNRRSDQLVAYIRAIGLRKGDQQVISIRHLDGKLFAENRIPPLDVNKAEFFISAGRRRGEIEWPRGFYEATFGIFNNGSEVLTKTFKAKIE